MSHDNTGLPLRERVKRVLEEFESLIQPAQPGKHSIEYPRVKKLVAEHADETVALVRGYIEAARDDPRYFPIALTLAVAYQDVYQDDSLVRYVQRERDSLGDVKMPQAVENPSGQPADPELIQLNVDWPTCVNADIYPFLKMLSFDYQADDEARQALRDLRARCFITFETDDDSREAWHIPEIRHFMAKLFDAMPYLPYYLIHHDELDYTGFVLRCLADPDAFDGPIRCNVGHPSVARRLSEAMLATATLASRLGDDAVAVCRDAFRQVLPHDTLEKMLANLSE